MTLMDLTLIPGAESVSQLVASSFVSGLWQGVVLAVGVAICLLMLPKTTAAVRFAIWTAVFLVLAVLPLVHASALLITKPTLFSRTVQHVLLGLRSWRTLRRRWCEGSFSDEWFACMDMEESQTRGGCDVVLSAAGFRGVQVCTSSDVTGRV
jgi:hypothetical protein